MGRAGTGSQEIEGGAWCVGWLAAQAATFSDPGLCGQMKVKRQIRTLLFSASAIWASEPFFVGSLMARYII